MKLKLSALLLCALMSTASAKPKLTWLGLYGGAQIVNSLDARLFKDQNPALYALALVGVSKKTAMSFQIIMPLRQYEVIYRVGIDYRIF